MPHHTRSAGRRRSRTARAYPRLSVQTLEARDVPAAFTAGDVVVYRVGDGSTAPSTAAAPVFLDEYTPTGTLVQSVPMPTADAGANQMLTASGAANASEGYLNRSADGSYLVLTGYDAAVGTLTVASSSTTTIARTIGRVSAKGEVDTSTTTTSFSGSSIRSAASADGSGFWSVGNATGVVYTPLGGSGTGTVVSNVLTSQYRTVGIADGQLYFTSSTTNQKGVNQVGTGLPTSAGAGIARLPGLTDTDNPSNYGFFFADLSPAVDGSDTLYVADDNTGGLTKYSLVGGSWTKNGTIGAATDSYRGLTGVVTDSGSGPVVTLFVVGKSSTAGQLFTLTDSSGYNGAFAGTPTSLVTHGTNEEFRGVALAPEHANTAPVNTLPATFAATEDTTVVLSGLAVADADAGTDPLVVTLSVTGGTLQVGTAVSGGLTAGQVSGNGSGTVTLTAPAAAINATLADAAGLTYSPAANANGDVTLTMTANDQGSFGNVGPTGPLTDTDQATISIAAVNDAPTQTVPGTRNVDEDTAIVFSTAAGTRVSVADVDAGTADVRLTLSAAHGTLSLASTANLTVGGNGTAAVTATGPLAGLNVALDGLTFTPDPDYNGPAAVTVSTDDQGNTGAGGPLTATDTIDINLAAVNDPPVNTVPATFAGTEDTSLALTGISVADVDLGANDLVVTLSVPAGAGSLTVRTDVPGGVDGTQVAGNGTETVTVTAPPAAINATLADAGGLVFAPAPDRNGDVTFTLTSDDQGNTGSGGPQTSVSTAALAIAAVNDPPVNLVPNGTVPATEDTPFHFLGDFHVAIADPDAGAGPMSVALTATHGTLAVADGPGVTGNGTAAVTVAGTLAELNAAVAGLTFVPDADYFGPATVQMATDDGGNTGAGGAMTDTDAIALDVAAVNDPPVVRGGTFLFNLPTTLGAPVGTVTATDVENDPFSFAITAGNDGHFAIDADGNITIADPVGLAQSYTLTVTATDTGAPPAAGSATVVVNVNSPPTADPIPDQSAPEDSGAFTLDLSAYVTDPDGAADVLTFTLVGDTNPGLFADVRVQGHDLVLTPAADANGSAALTVRATDRGGLTVDAPLNFTVNPVNDPPTVDQPADVQVGEDAAEQTVTLTGISPGPANEAGQAVTVTATSSDPTVIPDPTVTYSGGSTATLTFTPRPDADGTVTITVTVRDDGGGADTTTRTFAVTVNPEGDRPVIDTSFFPMLPPVKVPVPRNTTPTPAPIGALVAHVTDPDAGAAQGVAITGLDTKDGKWEFSTDGGATWAAIPAVSDTNALLLAADGRTFVRFTPNKLAKGVRPFTRGFADLTYRAWDQTAGTAGQVTLLGSIDASISAQTERAWVQVGRPVPQIDAGGRPILKAVREDVKASPAYAVKQFLGLLARETDPTRVFGIALSGTTGTGTWEFNTGKGGWQPLGAVGDSAALLLRPTDRVRFKPGKDFDGEATLVYHTWDLAAGAFGTKVDPAAAAGVGAPTETAALDILPVNDLPVLNVAPTPTLPSVHAGETTAPVLVSALLNGAATDVDSPSIGIKVVAATGGTWEYSRDGVTWTKVRGAVYLAPDAQLRFTAAATARPGSVATLKYKAWDGFKPTAAVSAATETVTVTILA